jgi:hypothetical protein
MRSRAIFALVFAVTMPLAAPGVTKAVKDQAGRCGMYPADVYELTYSAWADCRLRDVGEKPLWSGVTSPRYRQQARFTFNDGHMRYTKVINFVELANGTGLIELKTIVPYGGQLDVRDRRRLKVSAQNVLRFNELARASDAWKFETGSWDGAEMYLHCEILEMERADTSGYRYSSVNISCNRPRKLEPLLDFVTGLVGLKMDRAAY